MPDRTKKLAEGKTKIIWQDPENPDYVLIESKDDLTAGDGERRIVLPGKGAWATSTARHCFQLLGLHRIPHHFLKQVDPTTFRARSANMIKLEFVARRRAAGSYLKRHPDVPEGTIFNDLRYECFLKDDARHDPLLVFDYFGKRTLEFDARTPMSQGLLQIIELEDPRAGSKIGSETLAMIHEITKSTFLTLEEAWRKLGVTLVDLKIEFGVGSDGSIFVADVIDNDSWRIWPEGDKSQMLDKQVFRDAGLLDPEAIQQIQLNYARVADMSAGFITA